MLQQKTPITNPPKIIPSATGKFLFEAPAKQPKIVIRDATGTPGCDLRRVK